VAPRMSLKVCLDQKGDRQSVTLTEKDKERKKRDKGSKRKSGGDLRAVISGKDKERREKEKERDRETELSGDLRDRLEKHRDKVDTKEFVEFAISKAKALDTCEISHLSAIGKQKLLSMYLDEKDTEKRIKGKENSSADDSRESNRSTRDERPLTSEWGQRKKKKKKKSRSRSKSPRRPLADKDTDNRKRKLSPDRDLLEIVKESKERRRSPVEKSKDIKDLKRSQSREREDKRKDKKKERKRSTSRTRKRSKSREPVKDRKASNVRDHDRKRSVSKDKKIKSPRESRKDRKRSRSRELGDRKISPQKGRNRKVSPHSETRSPTKRLKSPLKRERRKSLSPLPRDKKASISPNKRDRKSSVESERKSKNKISGEENPQSPVKSVKEVSGRKHRIDSGISTGTNFSKESGGSVSLSPNQSPHKEVLSNGDILSSPRKQISTIEEDGVKSGKSSPNKESSVKDEKERSLSPSMQLLRAVKNEIKNEKEKARSEASKEKSFSPSPSPPRRVLEVDDESKPEDEIKEDLVKKEKDEDLSLSSSDATEKNNYSVYEEKHGKNHETESRRSRDKSRDRKDREVRTSSDRHVRESRERDRDRRLKERDIKRDVDRERYSDRRRYRRSRSRSRGRRRRPSDESYRPRRERYRRYPSRERRRYSNDLAFRSPGRPETWEDQVENFLQGTSGMASTLVTINTGGPLPQDFDPSRPPPGVTTAVAVPPDYALTEYTDPLMLPQAHPQPIRQLTDVTTGQLIPQQIPSAVVHTPALAPTVTPAAYLGPAPVVPSQPPPDYQGTVDFTITRDPLKKVEPSLSKEDEELAKMNQLNQENEKNRKENKPLSIKEKKKLEKGQKEIWQFVAKKLLTDPVFCAKTKKKKAKSVDDLKEKADKCAIRIGLKLEKSGYSETRLWKMLKDNEKGIQGFFDELKAAVLNSTIEVDVDARKPKDRLDAELLQDGTIFKYIGQYIQGNPYQERVARKSTTPTNELPTTNDLQSILQHFNLPNVDKAEKVPESLSSSGLPNPDTGRSSSPESAWDFAFRSFAPFKSFLESKHLVSPTADAYVRTLVVSGFNYITLGECTRNFQPPSPSNPGEPPQTVYGHLLDCLREISFERYPSVIQDNIDGHTVAMVKLVLEHFSSPQAQAQTKNSPLPQLAAVPEVKEEVVPLGGNTTEQLPKKTYVTVAVSVDTIPMENKNHVWQICLHTPGLPEEEDPDYECMMVPTGVPENRLAEAGFLFNQEKQVWYHEGTEFGRRKADLEEKSVEKLVNYLEELRSGGRGAGLNNGIIMLFECSEDLGLVRSLLSSHSADIWRETVRGVACIDHFLRQSERGVTYCPPYFKFQVGGDSGGTWLTSLVFKEGKTMKIEADTRAEIVYNILEDVLGECPTFENFTRWYCYPSMGDTAGSLARDLELIRQCLPLQTHVDRQLFNARVQCVLEVVTVHQQQEQSLVCRVGNLIFAQILLFLSTFQTDSESEFTDSEYQDFRKVLVVAVQPLKSFLDENSSRKDLFQNRFCNLISFKPIDIFRCFMWNRHPRVLCFNFPFVVSGSVRSAFRT